jgi:hypothetical protein
MSPASTRTDLAHPSIVRKAVRLSSSASKSFLAARETNPWDAPAVPAAANTRQGFGIVGARAFPPVLRLLCTVGVSSA